MLGWPKLISFSIALHIASASAALVNHTIDDAFGDDAKTGSVTYDSPDSWHQGQGLKCTGCSVAAGAGDPSHWGDSQGPYMGTWHTNQDTESTNPSIDVKFSGQAIYVYGIIFAYSTSRVLVSLDGSPTNQDFLYKGQNNPIQGPQWRYDQLLYSNTGLNPGDHTITLTNNRSVVMFDYAVYSTEASQPSAPTASSSPTASPSPVPSASAPAAFVPSSQVNVSAVIGGAIAGCILVALVLIGLFFFLRRRAKRLSRDDGPLHIQPQPPNSGSQSAEHQLSSATFSNSGVERSLTSSSSMYRLESPPPYVASSPEIRSTSVGQAYSEGIDQTYSDTKAVMDV